MRISTSRFLLISSVSLSLSAVCTQAAVYQEIGGQVVVEAEHFDSRATDTADNQHHWHVVPDDDNIDFLMDSADTYGSTIFVNARGGKYVTPFPDAPGGGQNNNTPDSMATSTHIDYKVQITRTGEYRLFLRWGGYDGSSDSIYAQIVELIDGVDVGQADWYRYAANIGGDFANVVDTAGGTAVGWNGDGAPEKNDAGGGEVPAVWTISTPGTYTIRILQREDGSALDALLLQLSSLPEPTDPNIAESPAGGTWVAISQQPLDATVGAGQTATFTAAATGTAPASYQWQKASPGSTNFANISGATSASYTTAPVAVADNGTQYRVVASISAGPTSTSRAAKLSVDVTPPSLVRASGSAGFDQVTVFFSEAVDPSTGTNTANYGLNGGLTISGARLVAGGMKVILSTSKQTQNASYTVTVNNVKDLVGLTLNPNPSQATFSGWVLYSSGVLHKFWNNILVNTIRGLTNNSRFPDSPSLVTIEPAFEYPPNGANEAGDNYGNQLSGILTAPLTGKYVFFTCSDDPSSLYLSTDENPANKHLIATETVWSDARSWVSSAGNSDLTAKRSDQYTGTAWPTTNVDGTADITLTAGKGYYIEVVHTEGGGGDNVGVNWIKPGGVEPVDLDPPIPGSALSFYYNPDSTVTITQQPQSASVAANSPVSFSVVATGSSDFGTSLHYQWQKSAPGGNFLDIPGANQAQYNIPFVNAADNQAQFRVIVAALPLNVPVDKGRTTSVAASLTVTTDTTPPVVRGVLSPNANTVLVKFTEPVNLGTAANYTIGQGISVTSVGADTNDAAGVVLTTSALTVGSRYTLTVSGVVDRAAIAISPNPTQKPFLSQNYLVGGAPGNAATLPLLPTNEKLELGALTKRGFVALVYQNARYNAQDGIARAEDLLAGRLGPNQAPTNMFTETGIINYARPAEITAMADKGHFIPDLPMPVIVPTASGAEDNFAFEILAFVELRAGIYRWGVNSDDGFRVSPAVSVTDPNNAITLGVFDAGRGSADTVFDFAVAEDGLYPIRLVYEEGGGDANVEWWSIPDVSTDDPTTATLAAINDPANATALKAFQPPLIPPAAQPQITSATLSSGRITIQWNNGGTLEYATSLNSPITWTPTGNSSGTFSEPAAGTKFYRVKR